MEKFIYLYIESNQMKQIQNIQHQSLRALTMSSTSLWSDCAVGNSIVGFTYNNEPKQGGTEV